MISSRFGIIFAWAFGCAVLLGSALAFSADFKPPTFQSDQERVSYLEYLEEHLPTLFEEPASYDRDFFEILDSQATLYEQLNKLPDFQTAMKSRPPLVEIVISDPSSHSPDLDIIHSPSTPEDKAQAESWKKGLIERTRKFFLAETGKGPRAPPHTEVHARLQTELKSLETSGSMNGFLTGLINSLPPTQRGAIFKMPLEQQLQALAHELPEDVIASGFRASNFGITAGHLSKEEALKMLRSRIQSEAELRDLLSLWLLTSEGGSIDAIPATLKKQAQRIIDETPLLKAKFKTAAAAPPAQKPSASLLLREVPPQIAVFRGCAGSDCSTKYSFGYPWDPMERVFYVWDEKGALKGYVSTTLVESGVKRALYVHTINGKRLSAANTEAVLSALHSQKSALGADEILLPVEGKVGENINFKEIQDVLRHHTKGAPEVLISYLNAKTRETLDQASTGKYDLMSKNKTAVTFHPKHAEPKNPPLKITLETKEPSPFVAKQISRDKALFMALNFSFFDNETLAEKIATTIGVNQENYKALVDVFKNIENLPIREFRAIVRASLSHLGVSKGLLADDALFFRTPNLIATGQLKAPDCLTPENRELTVGLATYALGSENLDQALVIALLKREPKAFSEDRKFLKAVKKLAFSDELEEFGHFQEVLASGFKIDLHALIQEGFADPEPHVRQGAARLAGEYRKREFQNSLIDGLFDPNESVSRDMLAAIQYLAQFNPVDTPRIRGLILQHFSNKDATIRINTFRAARAFYSRAEIENQFIDHVLHDSTVETQIEGLEYLRESPLNDSKLRKAIIQLSKHLDPRLRTASALAFSHMNDLDSLSERALTHLLADPIASVRQGAIDALTSNRLVTPKLEVALVETLGAGEEEFILAVLKSLNGLRTLTPSAASKLEPKLIELWNSGSVERQLQILNLLSSFPSLGSDSAIATGIVELGLKSTSSLIIANAIQTVGNRKMDDLKLQTRVLQFLKHKTPEVSEAAVQTLINLKSTSPNVTDEILKQCETAKPALRERALRVAIGTGLDPHRVKEAVISALTSPNSEVAASALTALNSAQKRGGLAIASEITKGIATVIRSPSLSPDLKLKAAQALAGQNKLDAEVGQTLLEIFPHSDPLIRANLAVALGRVQSLPPESIAALATLTKNESNDMIQMSLESALKKLKQPACPGALAQALKQLH